MRLSSPGSFDKLDREDQWRNADVETQMRKTSVSAMRLATKIEKMKNQDNLAVAINQSLPASCTVVVQDGEDRWNGSGFLLRNGRVVTAYHVIENLSETAQVAVYFDIEAQPFVAQVSETSPDFDLGVLVLQDVPPVEPMMLANPKDLIVGEQIAVVGSPGGWHDVVTTGRVAAINQNIGDVEATLSDFILIDADIEPGSSGSMVIDEDGNVIGMVSAAIGEHASMGIGKRAVIPVGKILNLLRKTH